MPHSAASDLGMHCLPLSYKKDARLIMALVKTGFGRPLCLLNMMPFRKAFVT